jgi:hypothetical protein
MQDEVTLSILGIKSGCVSMQIPRFSKPSGGFAQQWTITNELKHKVSKQKKPRIREAL